MKVTAVVVLYFPDKARFLRLIEALYNQVSGIFLLDNTPGGSDLDHINSLLDLEGFNQLFYTAFNKNIGIAEAQNRGARMALEAKADFVLFLDQDSVPQENLVGELISAWNYLTDQGEKIAVVGPGIKNDYDDKVYRARMAKEKQVGNHIFRVNQIISSGSLIRLDTLQEVGYFESRLFIDGVDFEWCWRAGKKGYHCFRLETVFLSHQFGKGEKKLAGVEIPIPSTERCYYLYRNYLLLSRRGYVPIYWKLSYLFKFALRFPYYSLFVRPQWSYFKNIVKGVTDGIKAHYGEPAK